MWTLIIQLLVASLASGLIEGKCTFRSPCSCTMDNGKVVDLSKIDKIAAYDAINKNNYIWKPCQTFDIGALKGVTFVQYAVNTKIYYDIGSDPYVEFIDQSGILQLHINSQQKDRNSFVILNCVNGTSNLHYLNEAIPKTYNFQLDSPYCCPAVPESSGGSLSIGSILTIVFFVLLFLYIVIGIIIQVKVRHAEGSDRIPNKVFWSALPGLIKDGFMFTISCFSRKTVYNKI